jgi:hypothetical protein
MEHDLLIRVGVLSGLLERALAELDDERFASPQLLEQLREVKGRAEEALGQIASSGGECPST